MQIDWNILAFEPSYRYASSRQVVLLVTSTHCARTWDCFFLLVYEFFIYRPLIDKARSAVCIDLEGFGARYQTC